MPARQRSNPNGTGIAIGLAVAVWLATRNVDNGPLRGVFVGIGTAAIVAHLLQRLDESIDSKRSYRGAKSRYLQALAGSIETRESQSSPPGDVAPASASETFDWLNESTATTIHLSKSVFDEESATETDTDDIDGDTLVAETADPRVAFESAMADSSWFAACEALLQGRELEQPFVPETAELDRLRKSAMDTIFQRMHTGTVREDVARLAQAMVDLFPDTTEGRTLAQVLGVLRRSAGLCPRCANPYKGVAAACHDCLRGTPEAYQIAWDDEIDTNPAQV